MQSRLHAVRGFVLSRPLQKALEDWGASVEKASNGTIKSKVYPSQQLGKAFAPSTGS